MTKIKEENIIILDIVILEIVICLEFVFCHLGFIIKKQGLRIYYGFV